jgi:site-specific DNA-methyltransferase (cytosine-N4-specific)
MGCWPRRGYRAKKRPSGHDISEKFSIENGAAIPPNLIAIPNTESNSFYQRYCEEHGLKPHPARYPSELPEYFIRMLTDPPTLLWILSRGAALLVKFASGSISLKK